MGISLPPELIAAVNSINEIYPNRPDALAQRKVSLAENLAYRAAWDVAVDKLILEVGKFEGKQLSENEILGDSDDARARRRRYKIGRPKLEVVGKKALKNQASETAGDLPAIRRNPWNPAPQLRLVPKPS